MPGIMITMLSELTVIGVFIVSLVRSKVLETLHQKRLIDLGLNEIVLVLLLMIVFLKVLFRL